MTLMKLHRNISQFDATAKLTVMEAVSQPVSRLHIYQADQPLLDVATALLRDRDSVTDLHAFKMTFCPARMPF